MTDKVCILFGDEIKGLIPQREPVIMVDSLYHCSDDYAVTGLTITEDNVFCKGSTLSAAGVIEHIAQSAAAFAGYPYYRRNQNPRIGYIGEIKNFTLHWQPVCGDALLTCISVIAQTGNVTLVEAETTVDEDLVAECRMKIFLKEDDDDVK